MSKVSSINSDEIISILKEEIENFDDMSKDSEVGTVISVGDGIATIYGIDHAMYGEIVTFETGLKGMVQDIRKNEIGCILFGSDTQIREGTKVTRTGKRAGVPVGSGFVGSSVNALGEPIDGRGEIKEEDYYPVEREAPGIIDRKSVGVPMETGILSIDAMFPIGREQKELISATDRPERSIHCPGYDYEPEGQGCDLCLCCHRTEGLYCSESGKFSEKLRSAGLYNYNVLYSKRLCSTSVYRALCGNCYGRILYVSGKRCADRV